MVVNSLLRLAQLGFESSHFIFPFGQALRELVAFTRKPPILLELPCGVDGGAEKKQHQNNGD